MVPKVTSAGRSFKSAARYYLHDKKADTSDRVAFVETINLPTDDPRRAVAHMIDTATHADELKKAAGIKGGRPLQKPVYTFALTWHPSNSNDHLKLSQWAEDYERRRGHEFCPERSKNNAKRRGGEWRKDHSDSRPVWMAWKKAQTKELWEEHRAQSANLRASRKGQYNALWHQRGERMATRRAEIKSLYRPIWRNVFKRQEKALNDFDAGLHKRIGFALSRGKGKALGVVQAVFAAGDLRRDFIREQEAERAEIAEHQGRTIRDAGREVTKAYKYDRDSLRAAHRVEDQARYDATKAKAREIWQVPEQTTQADFDQTADRRRPENKTEREGLEQAPEPEKKRARRSAREIMGEQRNRSRSRSRRPKR
jgi:hypothetical protein|tara:strand:+ start:3127 stop:4230 length:1104 start_codon:yes stop_codon:yes gene_type:complete